VLVKIRDEINRGQAEIISEAAETLQHRYNDHGIDLGKVEGLVLFAATLCDNFEQEAQERLRQLFSGAINNVLEEGNRLFASLQAISKAVADVDEIVRSTQGRGFVVMSVSLLDTAKRKLRAIKADLELRWPRFDEDELRRGMEEADRGELLDVGDLLRELESRPGV
jgi:predicted transcriptional regulator